MSTDANAVLVVFEPLVEKYMTSGPLCLVCRDQPATAPMVFVPDHAVDGRVVGCVFAVCAVCLCAEDFQAQVRTALSKERRQERGRWN
jgi:hypothetical protein